MKTVVSLTPLPLDRDSRTLKIAASLARLGYRSVVVENRPSAQICIAPGVEVITLGRRKSQLAAAPSSHLAPPPKPVQDDLQTRIKQILRPLASSWLRERIHFVTFIAAYFLWRPLLGVFQIPKADLYYLHEYRLYPTIRLLQLLRKPIPLIYDAHDIYAEVWDNESLSPFWRHRFVPFLLWLERLCANASQAVVTVGNGVSERIGHLLGVIPRVLRNSHDTRLEQPVAEGLRQRLGLGEDARLVVVVGNRKPGQSIEPIIAALAHQPSHVHLAFVGRFYDDVAELATRHRVATRVHTPGAVPPERIVPHIRSADAAAILYFPHSNNTRYILPNGFFQSISAGLPLLYPALPELETVIGQRPVGLRINPCETDSLIQALAAMTGDDQCRRIWAAETARLADEIGWEREEQRLSALIAEILKD